MGYPFGQLESAALLNLWPSLITSGLGWGAEKALAQCKPCSDVITTLWWYQDCFPHKLKIQSHKRATRKINSIPEKISMEFWKHPPARIKYNRIKRPNNFLIYLSYKRCDQMTVSSPFSTSVHTGSVMSSLRILCEEPILIFVSNLFDQRHVGEGLHRCLMQEAARRWREALSLDTLCLTFSPLTWPVGSFRRTPHSRTWHLVHVLLQNQHEQFWQ